MCKRFEKTEDTSMEEKKQLSEPDRHEHTVKKKKKNYLYFNRPYYGTC